MSSKKFETSLKIRESARRAEPFKPRRSLCSTLFSSTLAALLAVAMVAGYETGSAQPASAAQTKVVKIGAVLPLSGPFADSAKDMKHVYDLYQQQINANGGFKSLGGAKVQFVYVDAQSKPEVARGAALRLALENDISALIGPVYSPLAIPMAEVAEKHKVPFVIDAAIEDSLTEKGYKYVFRGNPRSKDFANAVSGFVIGKLKPKNVALVYADSISYGSVMSTIKKNLKAANIPVLLEEPYAVTTTNFGPIVEKLANSKPDVVLAGSYDADAILIARTIAEQGIKLKGFVGAGGGYSTLTFLSGAGKAAEGIASAASWGSDDKSSPDSPKFIAAFKHKYSEVPNQMNASAATAAQILLDAIERAGSSDREKIREALTKTNLWTVEGKIQFDNKGQGLKSARIIQVQKGHFVTIWPAALAAKTSVPFHG